MVQMRPTQNRDELEALVLELAVKNPRYVRSILAEGYGKEEIRISTIEPAFRA